jgi:flagellar protein FlbD
MLKLTRLDHRVVAINPDHIAWVEATPDTTLCLLGDRKVIVRESVDEVIERFVAARKSVGCTAIPVAAMTPSQTNTSSSRRPSGSFAPRQSGRPSAPAPQLVEGSATGATIRFDTTSLFSRRERDEEGEE